MSGSHEKRNLIIAGLIIGAIAGFLVLAGNPGNMGFCIACFVRDTVGGLGLHRAICCTISQRRGRRISTPKQPLSKSGWQQRN